MALNLPARDTKFYTPSIKKTTSNESLSSAVKRTYKVAASKASSGKSPAQDAIDYSKVVGLGAGAGIVGAVPQPEIDQPPLIQAVGAIPAAASAAGIALPPALLAALGLAGAGYGVYQALGGGEGGGLFGNNLLGGDEFYMDGIPFGGPGLAEPPAEYLLKEWHVSYDWGRLQYYLVQMPGAGRKIACYNTATKRWKVWRFPTPRLAVIGKNMPSHKMLTRLRRNLKKQSADARTILKLTSPKSLRTPRRRR